MEKKKSIKAKAEMTEMLELSDKAFKVAMLKCFNKQLQTLWKQIKTQRASAKKIKAAKKNQMKNLELKNIITEIKRSVAKNNSRMEETEKTQQTGRQNNRNYPI